MLNEARSSIEKIGLYSTRADNMLPEFLEGGGISKALSKDIKNQDKLLKILELNEEDTINLNAKFEKIYHIA